MAVGKPTVAVISMGRPQGPSSVIDSLPAVLTAYFGGPRQGIAIADALRRHKSRRQVARVARVATVYTLILRSFL